MDRERNKQKVHMSECLYCVSHSHFIVTEFCSFLYKENLYSFSYHLKLFFLFLRRKKMLNRTESLSLWLFLLEDWKYKCKTLGPVYIVLILFSAIATPLDISL